MGTVKNCILKVDGHPGDYQKTDLRNYMKCDEESCMTCGWNMKIDKARRKEMEEKGRMYMLKKNWEGWL